MAIPATASAASGGVDLPGATPTVAPPPVAPPPVAGSSAGAPAAPVTSDATLPPAPADPAPGPVGPAPAPPQSSGHPLPAHQFGSRLLTVRMRGTDVRALEHDLSALGFRTVANGRFTRSTLRRLKAFQRHYDLSVDGVAGPSTIGKLKRLLRSSLHIRQNANPNGRAAADSAPAPLSAGDSGGVGFVPAAPVTSAAPAQNATLIDGLAVPAAGTPEVVDQVIAAANKIAFRPYIYGGGHRSFNARGYDCSGSVSYALHAGGLLATPLDSEQMLRYGAPGAGNWITLYTNGPTHAYLAIAGLWFDTAAQTATNGMDRWSTTEISEPGYGRFVPRHPAGW